MSNSMFIIIITCAALFAVYFILFGYFSYRKKGINAKGVSKVFLVQGILLMGIYIGLVVISLVSPSTLGLETSYEEKDTKVSDSIIGLEGSVGNTLESKYEYPPDPIVAGMLSRGDEFLKQGNIQEAINEFKQGLNNEDYKDIFEKRVEYANDIKEDFKIYQRGLNCFNKGDYEGAYNEFKDIKPNDMPFYLDVINKMESISSGILVNSTPTDNQASTGDTPPSQNIQGNNPPPALP